MKIKNESIVKYLPGFGILNYFIYRCLKYLVLLTVQKSTYHKK